MMLPEYQAKPRKKSPNTQYNRTVYQFYAPLDLRKRIASLREKIGGDIGTSDLIRRVFVVGLDALEEKIDADKVNESGS